MKSRLGFHHFALTWVPFLCWCGLGVGAINSVGDTLRIKIDTTVACQVIDGFGASDAWQCDLVGKRWPMAKREQMADWLFSREADAQGNPKGIGLSIWRFNIGAGTAEQGDGSDIRNPWRRAECFQNADGTYDWSKQAGQQWFLRAARQRGVEKFLAFPNAAPVHLAQNGKGYAPKGPPHMNLKPGKMGAYAGFLADVLEHFSKEGLIFDYLSPINEPQWAWDEPKQEGTPALNLEMYALVRYLSHELSQRKLATQIVIGEAGTIGHACQRMREPGQNTEGRDAQAPFFFSPNSPFYVGDLPQIARIISAHSYFSTWPLDKQVDYRRQLHTALQAVDTQLGYWMSEYCVMEDNSEIGGGGRRDLGMDTALYVARLIHNDLVIAQARSWQWWTAISQVDYKDGLLYLDDGSLGESGRMGPRATNLLDDGVVRASKLLWALGNYSRFVRPGMVRVKCEVEPAQSSAEGVLVSAYGGKDGQRVLVCVNLSRVEQICEVNADQEWEVYTTSAKANLEKSKLAGSNLKLPARSVVTCIGR